MKKLTFVFVFTICISLFTGCDTSTEQKIDKTDYQSMLSFDNLRGAFEEGKALSTTSEDNVENSKNVISFGEFADRLMDEIDIKNFQSKEALDLFMSENSEYLKYEIIDGETYIESRYKGPYQYIMNRARLFESGGQVFKVFENGILGQGGKTLEQINSINDFVYLENSPNFLASQDEKNASRVFDSQNNCGYSKTGSTTNGNERVKVNASMDMIDLGSGVGSDRYIYYSTYTATNYRKFAGIWGKVKRTTKGFYSIRMDIQASSGWTYIVRAHEFSGQFKKEVIFYEDFYQFPTNSIMNYHMGGVFVWADNPSVNAADKTCNQSAACNVYNYPGGNALYITCVPVP